MTEFEARILRARRASIEIARAVQKAIEEAHSGNAEPIEVSIPHAPPGPVPPTPAE